MGSDALIQDVECSFLNVPLHFVNLKSDFVNGSVTVGVMDALPVSGVHLLLGNDLAGDKVVINPLDCQSFSESNRSTFDKSDPFDPSRQATHKTL